MFYGAGARAAVAVRLKNQVNENAKMAAFAGAVPEIAHNEILGWMQTRRAPLRLSAVFLRDPDEPAATAAIADGLEQLVVSDGAAVERWVGDGADEPSRVFALLAFGDLVSCYLAAEEGVDAFDITRLTDLKARLADAR